MTFLYLIMAITMSIMRNNNNRSAIINNFNILNHNSSENKQ